MKKFKQIITVVAFAIFMIGSFSGNAQSNSKNPYDYIGKIHNEILMDYKKNSKNESVKESYLTMIDLLNNNSLAKKHGIIEEFNNKTLDMLENGAYHVKNEYVDLINNLKIGKSAKSELLALKTYILETTLNNNISFNKFYEHLTSNENRIIKLRLNSYERKIVLGAYSVARYSYYFWDGKLGISPDATSKKGGPNVALKRGFWGTVLVIGGDVAGWFGTGNLSGAAEASHLIGEAVDKK